MNTDQIEICGAEPEEVLALVNTALDTTLEPRGHYWFKMFDPEYRMSLQLSPSPVPTGYEGPELLYLELRGCWIDLDDERNLEITRWIVGYLWDALADGTDWHLLWTSDDEPGDAIVRERRSVHGPNIPSSDEMWGDGSHSNAAPCPTIGQGAAPDDC